MAQKSVIGLILVVGLVAAAGWCFMLGPCKKWLDDLTKGGGVGKGISDIENAIGGALNPTGHGATQAQLTDNLNKSVADLPKTILPGNPVPLTGVFDIATGKQLTQKVSQSQFAYSPPSSFTQAYMGHLSYW